MKGNNSTTNWEKTHLREHPFSVIPAFSKRIEQEPK
jgi:hypothetical protein